MFDGLKTRSEFWLAVYLRLPLFCLAQKKLIDLRIVTLSIVMAIAVTLGSYGSVVHAKSYPKEQVRAAFLLNFLKFVVWPEQVFNDDESPFRICMFGDIGSKKYFNKLSQQTAKSRSIEIDYAGVNNSANLNSYNYDACHIVYIGFMQTNNAVAVLKAVADKPLLTVSIINNFIANGGMIALVSQEKKNKLQINLKEAQSVDLKISANMLDVAEIIEP